MMPDTEKTFHKFQLSYIFLCILLRAEPYVSTFVCRLQVIYRYTGELCPGGTNDTASRERTEEGGNGHNEDISLGFIEFTGLRKSGHTVGTF